jgi:LPXTG-motif cell wall-anchored protein
MVQRAVRRFRVFVPVVVVLGLLTTIWTPMPSAFAAKPTFTSVTPSFGSVTGGTAIYIVGTNFKPTGSTNVTIGGSVATSVVVTGTTSLTAVTPSGSAGAKDIVITTTGGGGGTVTVAGAFTYIQYYTVTYNGNSNTGGMVPVDGSSPYASGGAVTVLGNTGMLVKTGYVFTNWNTVANGSGTPYSAGNTFGIGANTILYAQWAITFTVTYNANGATGGSVPVDGTSPYASGVTVTVLGNTGSLVKTGNTFANWNTAANGSGTSYAPSGTFGIGANTILYAQWRAAVIYNGNGATGGSVPVDAASPYLNGAIVTVLGNTGSLVKTGYTFANWNTAADGSGTSFSVGNTFGIGADTVLYAQWAVITYTVTYNANGATSGTAPVDGSSPYASGTTVTVLGNSGSLVKTGYGFANWNTAANGSGTSYAPSASFTIGANTILYAQWATTYTVTYNGNAKTGGSSPTEGSIPYASGATVTVLGNTGGLVKTGNTFDNWNTAADGSGTSYAGGDTFVIGVDTILYAQWRAAVTYDGNGSTGGTVPVDGSSPYLNGSTVTVLGNTGSLVKAGYSFDNWNTSADGSGTSYATGNTFAIGANTILYAQWTVTNSVTYNANGATSGTVPVDGLSPYANGASVTVLSNSGSLARIGNTFANWNTAANGSGTSYAPSGTFTIGTNTILYAQWRTTVTYSGNGSTGGTVPVDASSPYLNGSTVSVLGNTGSLVKADGDGDSFYIFANWNTAADGSGTCYAPSATFVVAIDTVLYAQWTAISYTVTYDANGSTGGTIPVDVSSPYLDGSTVTVLGNTGSLVKTGYVFTHWNTAADGSGTSYAPSDTFVITDEIVLYPEWSPVGSYTVTYSGNGSTGGTVPVDGSSPYLNGATVSVLGNTGSLVRTDNTFANWNSAADGSGTSYAPAATFSIAVSTILYAQWKVAVIYNGNGSTGGTVPVDASSPYLNGTTVSVLGNTGSLVRTDNTFANWNTAANGSGTSYAPSATFAISIDTVLYAQWSPIGTYTVTYNGNGSTGGTIPVDGSSPYFSGTSVTILSNSGSLVRTGNTFANWNTTANGSGTAYTPTATFSIAVDTVLYAQWRTAVTYNGNGSTGGTVPVDGANPYLSGATVGVLGNIGSLIKTGNIFADWNTTADGSGTSYEPAATFSIGSNTILYAQWKATITYNGNGATGGNVPADGSSPYLNGSTVTVLGNSGSLVRTGYTFDHWCTSPDNSGQHYLTSDTFAIAADTVLYAQWAPIGSYLVSYNDNGSTSGTAPVDGSSPYLSGSTVTVLGNSGSLAKSGSTFANWNTKPDGSGTSYAPSATITIGASIFLYAQWATNSYTIAYNSNGSTGGSVPVDGSSPYLSGSTVTVLGNSGSLVKTAYTFANWNTAANGSGTAYTPADALTISNDTVLYAQWAPVGSYIVAYNGNGSTGGSVPVDGSSPYLNGSTVSVLGNSGSLVRTGYVFAHWNTTTNGSGISYSAGNTFAIEAETILYAQWSIVAPPVPPVTSLPPIATIERPVTEVVRADATADTVVDATILGIGGIQSVVSVTIPAGAISRDITITITPAVGPAEISSGFITIRVTATDSSGTSVTQFNKPLIIDLGHVNAGASVIFSQDGIAWIPIQLLSGTALPDGMQEGYYLAADGHTIILTRHLTYFGVKKTQVRLRVLSSAYILKVGEHATLTTIGGSGSGLIGYVTTTPSICSVSDAGSVRALTAGVCIVEAMKSGVAAYMNVLSLPLNLTIQRLVQAPFTLISGTDILSVGDSSTLTTSGGSGDGVIKFSTTTPTYCSVSDAGLVRALVSGNCIVEATKAGNDTYLEASAWPMYLTIERVLSVPALSPTPGTTVNGGLLPKTGSPWYNLLALGIGLILLGGVGRARRKRSKPYSAS